MGLPSFFPVISRTFATQFENSINMLEKGLQHTSSTVVSAANSARTMGSGDLDVFATPSMVALMENAAMLAVAAERRKARQP